MCLIVWPSSVSTYNCLKYRVISIHRFSLKVTPSTTKAFYWFPQIALLEQVTSWTYITVKSLCKDCVSRSQSDTIPFTTIRCLRHQNRLNFAFKSLLDKNELKSTQAGHKGVLIIVFVPSSCCQYLEDDNYNSPSRQWWWYTLVNFHGRVFDSGLFH